MSFECTYFVSTNRNNNLIIEIMDTFKTIEHAIDEITDVLENLGFDSTSFENDTTTVNCECGETSAIVFYSFDQYTPHLTAGVCDCCGNDDNFSDEVIEMN